MHKHELLAIQNDKLRRYATFASMSTASILIIAKIVAYLMTDSVSILSSLVDSMFDLVASCVTAFGVARALMPPDRNHRYGHGKAEPLAVLAQGVFMIGTSVALGYEAIDRFYHPQVLHNDMAGYAVMALSIVLTIMLVSFQHHVVHQTGSVAIHADRLHYASDVAVNIAVVAAFALNHWTGLTWFDPVFAALIAAGLLYSAIHILQGAMKSLMDAELPDADREKIKAIVVAQPGVRGMHDMRTRTDSDRIFIDMHVEMDGDMPLRTAHELSEKICDAIRANMPNAEIIIHQDPAGIVEDRLDTQIARQSPLK
jgi:ferrous-iron efflux pump FieF